MTPNQKELTTRAIADLRTVSIIAPEPHDGRSFSDVMRAAGIAKGFIDFGGGSATGFSAEGQIALEELAKSYRPEGSHRSRQASNATLAEFLSAAISNSWKDRIGNIPEDADFEALNTTVVSWFAALTQTHLHAVPCILAAYYAPPFSIGPVHFYHWHDFPVEQFGITREQFWATGKEDASNPDIGGWHFRDWLKWPVTDALRGLPWLKSLDVLRMSQPRPLILQWTSLSALCKLQRRA